MVGQPEDKARRPRKMKEFLKRILGGGGKTIRGQKITAVVGCNSELEMDERSPSTPSGAEAELRSWKDEGSPLTASSRSSDSHPCYSESPPHTVNGLATGLSHWDHRTTDGHALPVQESTRKWLQAWSTTYRRHQRAAGQALAMVLAVGALTLPFLVSLVHVFPPEGLFNLPNPWRSIFGLALFAAGVLPQLLHSEQGGHSKAIDEALSSSPPSPGGMSELSGREPSWSKENAFKLPYDISKKLAKSGQENVTKLAGFLHMPSRTTGPASVVSAAKPVSASAKGLPTNAAYTTQAPQVKDSNVRVPELANEHWAWYNKWQLEAVAASRATAAGVGLGMLVGRAWWHPPVWMLLAIAASWLLLALPCRLKERKPFSWKCFTAVWSLKAHFDARLYSFF